jgi:hypothetical protein
MFIICDGPRCPNYAETFDRCGFWCMMGTFLKIVEFATATIGPIHGLARFLIEVIVGQALGKGIGSLPGGKVENPETPEVPELPQGSDASTFHPVVLGFDTALYKATSGKAGPRLHDNVFSPEPPARTTAQPIGMEWVFPKGTVVLEGMVNGVKTIIVPQPQNVPGAYLAVTWPLQ